jgi:hypothetical protein
MAQDDERPEYVTTEAIVRNYQATEPIFASLLAEVRELSKKKPEATMSPGKVKIINRVLVDLLVYLTGQPEGKYLEKLDDQALPQVSDALLVMVQFNTALVAFKRRHKTYDPISRESYWNTEEGLQAETDLEDDESAASDESDA